MEPTAPVSWRTLGHLVPLVALVATLAACSRRENPEPVADAAPFTVTFGTSCPDIAVCSAACDAGDSTQCRRLGDALQFGQDGGPTDDRAAASYERACALLDGAGCLSAGQMYEYHHGVAKDDAKAAALYKRSCDLGYIPGCANLGIMLENGRGLAKDPAAALGLYKRSCAAGVSLACERARVIAGDGSSL